MSAVRCFAQQGVAQGVAVKPKVKLVGHEKFQRHNPRSDKFPVHRFHHVEFWCSDATNTYKRWEEVQCEVAWGQGEAHQGLCLLLGIMQ